MLHPGYCQYLYSSALHCIDAIWRSTVVKTVTLVIFFSTVLIYPSFLFKKLCVQEYFRICLIFTLWNLLHVTRKLKESI